MHIKKIYLKMFKFILNKMYMKNNLYILLSFLSFFLNFRNVFANFGPKISSSGNTIDGESVPQSESLDIGPCPCDLTNRCDYRCCCDNDCDDEIEKEYWIGNDTCINKKKERMEDFKCLKNNETFKYNKKKAGLSIKDHIYNIMCIQFDNSGDMGEFYLKEDSDSNIDDTINLWKKDFFGETRRIRRLEEKIFSGLDLHIYKPNSKGECYLYDNYEELKPIEYVCNRSNIAINFEEISKNIINEPKIKEEEEKKISEITLIVQNDSKVEVEFLNSSKNADMLKFKVIWKYNQNKNNENKKDLPKGYIQGNPIKIALNNEANNNDYYYYTNGYFIGMSNKTGDCIYNNDNAKENEDEIQNLFPISFKKNLKYSCKKDNTKKFEKSLIYDLVCNKNLYIAKYYNSKLDNIKEETKWIEIPKLNCSAENITSIKLIVITSKEMDEETSIEYIEHASLNITTSGTYSDTISFEVKFFELTYSTIMNIIEGKTSTSKYLSKILSEYFK